MRKFFNRLMNDETLFLRILKGLLIVTGTYLAATGKPGVGSAVNGTAALIPSGDFGGEAATTTAVANTASAVTGAAANTVGS